MQNMIPIGLMNLNIIAGKRIGDDMMKTHVSQQVRGMVPEAICNDTNAKGP